MAQKKSLTNESKTARLLLEIVDQLSGDLLNAFTDPHIGLVGYNATAKREIEIAIDQQEKRRALKRLKDRKLVIVEEIGRNFKVLLTDDGLCEVFRLKVLSAGLLEDGRDCMVIFDIPETERKVRKMIRRLLRSAGFIPIQRSVWISPFDAMPALLGLFDSLDTKGWVRVFYSEERLFNK